MFSYVCDIDDDFIDKYAVSQGGTSSIFHLTTIEKIQKKN